MWSEITLEGFICRKSILTPHSTLHTPRNNSLIERSEIGRGGCVRTDAVEDGDECRVRLAVYLPELDTDHWHLLPHLGVEEVG